MRKLRAALTALAALSMVLGTMGAATAQGSGQWETRADFILQLDKAMGIQPVYPPTPDFQDVSPSSPYYGYIEAAYQAGITNGISQGVFGPSFGITRAEAAKYLVIAFGAGSAAQNITTTSFSDNGDIPTALVGYVGEAAALGLMKGLPGGTFNPDANLTVAQEGYLLGQLQTATSALTLKVTPSATDVAPGQAVTLQTTATTASGAKVPSPVVTYSVTGTNAASALIAGNTFVGSTAGNYTVQAAAGSSTATAQVSVYGTAASLKVNAPTSVVANGVSTKTVTVDVVDANGNIVGNNTDQISFASSATAAAGFYVGAANPATSATATAVGGVATFTLQSGRVAGSSTLLSASDGLLVGSATVSAAAQVPTSVAVTAASPYLTANGTSGSDLLSAQVLDQTGSPLLSGAYTVSFAATGPANFGGLSTAAGVYYGPSEAAAAATLNDVQGTTGAVTVTASGTGLTSGTASVTAVIAGAPAQLAISKAQTITADTGNSPGATYTVTLEDSHGYPATAAGATNVTVTDSDPLLSTSATVAAGQSTGSFTLHETTAGSYTLTASDAAAGLASATSTLTVTSGAISAVAMTPGSTDPYQLVPYYWNLYGGYRALMFVPTSSPTAQVKLQLTDAYGNPVAAAGVEVDFYLDTGSATAWPLFSGSNNTGSGTLTAGGSSVASTAGTFASYGPAAAYTNSSGVATASIAMQPYKGDSYQIGAEAPAYGAFSYAPTFELAQNVPATNSLTVWDKSSNVVSTLVSGQTYSGSISQFDSLGNPAARTPDRTDDVLVTLGGTGSATLSGSYVYSSLAYPEIAANQYIVNLHYADSITIIPKHAGSLTISLQSLDVYNAAAQTTAYQVTPNSEVAQVGFSSGGAVVAQLTPLAVTAGTAYPITVTAQDAGGNPIAAANTIPVYVGVSGVAGGEFRATTAGTDIAATTISSAKYYLVDIPAGQTGTTFYYVPAAPGSAYFTYATPLFQVSVAGGPPANAPPYTTPVHATVLDASGALVYGATVLFTIPASDPGSLSATTAATGPGGTSGAGIATVTYTNPNAAGTSSGTVNVTAQVAGTTAENSAAVTY